MNIHFTQEDIQMANTSLKNYSTALTIRDLQIKTMRFFDIPIRVVKIKNSGTSLVAQWLRIRLPVQGTRVRALVREDPTCRRATKPMHHNY